jgi:hypothetical protein
MHYVSVDPQPVTIPRHPIIGRAICLEVYFLFLTLLITTSVFAVFLNSSEVNANPRASFPDMVTGHAFKPYVYRALVPTITRMSVSILPSAMKAQVDAILWRQPLTSKVLVAFRAQPANATEAAVTILLMYLSLFGFVLAFRKLCNTLYDMAPHTSIFLSSIAAIGLIIFCNYGYVYDYTTLFLFTLSFLFLVRSQWKQYLVSFAITCINKETTILLTFIFLMYYGRKRELPKRTFLMLFSVQVITYSFIKLCLFVIFVNNPGGNVEYYLPLHLIMFLGVPQRMIVFTTGQLAIFVGALYQWRRKPIVLLHAASLAMPLCILYFFFGYPFEIRVFYEIYPMVLLLVLQTVGYFLNWRLSPKVSKSTQHTISHSL